MFVLFSNIFIFKLKYKGVLKYCNHISKLNSNKTHVKTRKTQAENKRNALDSTSLNSKEEEGHEEEIERRRKQ